MEESNKGNQRALVKKRNEIDEIEQKRAIGKKRNHLDEGRAIAKKRNQGEIAIVEKRNQLDEERAIGKKRDEDIAIGNFFDETKHNGKERAIAIVKERNQLDDDDDEERAMVSDEINERQQKIICKSLPEELWTDNILTRLPARSLARCSFLCKQWYKSIYKDTRFAALHYAQNKNKTSLIFSLPNVHRRGVDKVYFFSLEEKEDNADDNHLHPKCLTHLETLDVHELVGYCNGLACIKPVTRPGDPVGSISVVNPIRAETLALLYVTPTGGYMYLCHGFGFDSLSHVYKAVIILTSKDNDEFLCMVITLGTSSWRNVTTTAAEMSPPPGSLPFPSRLVTRVSRSSCKPATLCGGDLFWRTTSEVDDGREIEMLLSFDLHNEKIQFIQFPAECTLTPPTTTAVDDRQYLVVDHLLEFKGYPCIARSEKIVATDSEHCGHRCHYQSNFNCCCCCKVHMYVLKDKVKQVWIREGTFDVQIKDQEGLLPAPLCCYFDTCAVTPPTRMLTLSDQVLLYWFTGESLIIYNLLEKYLRVVKCSRSYPGVFRTKMNVTLGRDDCPYMDYQLHAQVENIVSLKTFIPKGAETSKYDCFEDFRHSAKSNPPAGWVVRRRKSLKYYAFREDKVVVDKVSDDFEGHPDGSNRSKKSGKAKQTLTAKKNKKAIPKKIRKEFQVRPSDSQLIQLCNAMVGQQQLIRSKPTAGDWMPILNDVPELDEELKLDAVDHLTANSLDASTFLALKQDLQKKWLVRKLRPAVSSSLL